MTFECNECQDKGLVPATDLREARRVDLPCTNPDCKALRRRAVATLSDSQCHCAGTRNLDSRGRRLPFICVQCGERRPG